MLNLLRMDLYRIFRNKSFYICFGILAFANVLAFLILFIIINPETRDFIMQHGAELTSDAADIESSLANTTILEVFRQGTVGGGFLSVTTGLLCALFVCMDFESGFVKNIMAAHENKWDYILSKAAVFGVINFLYLTVTFLATLLLNVLSGGIFMYSSPGDILFYLFSAWMIVNGFSSLTLLICMVTRSKAAGVAGAICLNSGLVVMIASTVFSLFGFHWIFDYSLYTTLASLPSTFQGNYSLRPIITGAVFFILYTVISKIVLASKDI